jgi:hypothetical protein
VSGKFPDVGPKLSAVRERIASAARRSGRAPTDVQLVAVTKGHDAGAILAAISAGCSDVGENYVQEMLAKMEAVAKEPGAAALRWHLIGPLQRNKARHVVGRAALVHTLDSEALALEIDRRAAAAGVVQDVLIQVNVGGEAQKSGVEPALLEPLLGSVSRFERVRVRGLMTIPPLADEPDATRPHFRALAELRVAMQRRFVALELTELSMGMSSDFEAAIEEGATIVRVGSAIFGERPRRGNA